jgi:hypothetical protein
VEAENRGRAPGAAFRAGADKRLRRVVTPEGVALPFAIGSRAARASALLLDLLFIVGSMVGTTLLLVWVAGGFGGDRLDQNTLLPMPGRRWRSRGSSRCSSIATPISCSSNSGRAGPRRASASAACASPRAMAGG